MATRIDVAPVTDHELVLARIIDAPRDKVYRCWTEPELMKEWFAPRPYTTPVVEVDLRPGGTSLIVMQAPDGTRIPCPGVYLEVVENERLVSTDAYTEAWKPSGKPFMTAIITFEDAGEGKTRYVARALHWSAVDREAHEKMGFHEGWGQVAEQLEAVARSL